MRWMRSLIAVLAFWLVLAIPAGPADLAWGLAVAALLGAWAVVVLWPSRDPGLRVGQLPALIRHLIGLMTAIVPAALQLIAIVVRPRMPLRPRVIKYTTELESDAARVALANSITLTPGTHCVELAGNELTVHCLDPSFAESLLSGAAEREIRRVFEAENES